MTQQSELIDRLRALLTSEPSMREVSMFGGRSFMVNDKMVASALKGGDLLIRVDAERDDELNLLPGASPAVMAAGRDSHDRRPAEPRIRDSRGPLVCSIGMAQTFSRCRPGRRAGGDVRRREDHAVGGRALRCEPHDGGDPPPPPIGSCAARQADRHAGCRDR